MDKQTLSTKKLAIIFFFTLLVINIVQMIPSWIVFSENYSSLYFEIIHLILALPIVMTVVVVADMIKHKEFCWEMVFITFFSYGTGAAFYPMWSRRTTTEDGGKFQRNYAVYAIIMALSFIWTYIKNAYFFKQFQLRNDWAPYLGWFITLLAVICVIEYLRSINCKHILSWIFLILLTLFNVNGGLLFLILYSMLFTEQIPQKHSLNKYLILIAIQAPILQICTLLFNQNGYDFLHPILNNVGQIISSIIDLVVIILLIIDIVKLPIKGKVWLILVSLLSPTYSLIAIQESNAKGQESEHRAPEIIS